MNQERSKNNTKSSVNSKKRLNFLDASDVVQPTIMTSKDMKGPNGPNAVLQRIYKEKNSVDLDTMPSDFKNYIMNMDRN